MRANRRSQGNLPADLTSFVGRREELAAARAVLPRTRLLTLTGAGGIGKTRLALRLAAQVARAYPAGAWRVDLAAVERPDLLGHAVLESLGLDHEVGRPVLEALTGHLNGLRMLLVVDNCEHLLEASATVIGTLLAALPGLQVIATSRQALAVEGEHLLTVPPLRAPHPEASVPAEAAARNEALELFTQRGAAAIGEFAPAGSEARAAALVCHRLDGIPLAIELAAARLRTMTCEEILQHLNNSFHLLSRGSRTSLPRHRTLLAALDWSFDHCAPEEQLLWARMSVFAGSADREAVEAVCSDDRLCVPDLLDLVAALVDKSVLIREDGDTGVRYRMLETVRAYGRRQLETRGEVAVWRRHHRDHYRRIVLRADEEWFTQRQTLWMGRLHEERPNLRAALSFCLEEPGESAPGLEVAAALWCHRLGAGGLEEERLWLAQTLAVSPEPSRAKASALWADGWLALLRGDHGAAASRVTQCRALAKTVGDERAGADAEQLAALAALFQDDFPTAIPLLEHTLSRYQALGALGETWSTLFLLGLACCLDGDPRAADLCREGLELCEKHDARWSRSWSLWLNGLLHLMGAEHERAAGLLQESLRLGRPDHNRLGVAQCLEVLAWTRARQDQCLDAAELLGSAQFLWQQIGSTLPGVGHLLRYRTECEARLRRELGEDRFQHAVKAGEALPIDQAVERALGAPKSLRQPRERPGTLLTARERQVAELVSQGLADKQIAALLVLSPRTVHGHVQRILVKLGFTSRRQIAQWAGGRPPAPP
ncbi:ATP-binding protein [Streptomyces bambusae]|uniref:AAA family ATPase n=1 Tax=Streptomyces bambusae TaxID=1550616 RepID=A0ABS6YYS2_9ACTN|nr:LuxR C-terminal-related transcriptional regulator [Streptomyces bambusae]MBW5480632.1 AAA family ATPase [Streptomyces bambusae]